MEGIMERIKRMQVINDEQADSLKQLYEIVQKHSSTDFDISVVNVKEKRILKEMDGMLQDQTRLLKEQGQEILESVEKVQAAFNDFDISVVNVKEKRILEEMDGMLQDQTRLLKEQGQEILEYVEKVQAALNETNANLRSHSKIQTALQDQTRLLKEQGQEILESVEKVQAALNETNAKLRIHSKIQIATLVTNLLWVSTEAFLAWKARGMMFDVIEGLPSPLKWLLKGLNKKGGGGKKAIGEGVQSGKKAIGEGVQSGKKAIGEGVQSSKSSRSA